MRKTLALTCMLLVVCCIFTGFAETIDTQTLFGKETDGVYENTFIGLGCELSGWYFYSEDDIARVNQWTKENMPEKVNEILEQAGNITIMAAESESGQQNINIQLQYIKEYLPIYNLFGIENVVKSQLDGITSVFEEAGMKNVHADMTEMLVCGKKMPCVNLTYEMQNVQTYAKEIFFIHGEYIVWITATSFSWDGTQDTFSAFYELSGKSN